MNIEQLEQTQAVQVLKKLWKPYYGKYHGVGLYVAMNDQDVYFIIWNGSKSFYFRSDMDTWQTYSNPDIVSKCKEIASL